jgi:hypothetical protein
VKTREDAPAIDWRTKYEQQLRHNEELMRQIERAFSHGLRAAGGNQAVRAALVAVRDRYRSAVG